MSFGFSLDTISIPAKQSSCSTADSVHFQELYNLLGGLKKAKGYIVTVCLMVALRRFR